MRGGGSRAVFRRIPLPFLPAPPPTVLPIDHRRADVRNTPSQCGRECSCRSASVAPPSRKVVSLHPATFHPVSGPSDARRVHCRAAAPCAPGIRPHAALQVRDCVTMRDDVCCPTCKAPRVITDGKYNIVVCGRDRNGSIRYLCKRCPGDASRFVLQQQPAHAAGSAKKAKDGGAAALPADTPPEAAAGGSGAPPSAAATTRSSSDSPVLPHLPPQPQPPPERESDREAAVAASAAPTMPVAPHASPSLMSGASSCVPAAASSRIPAANKRSRSSSELTSLQLLGPGGVQRQQFADCDTVMGRYNGVKGGKEWFPAEVISYTDGWYHLKYFDGDVETKVAPKYVRAAEAGIGRQHQAVLPDLQRCSKDYPRRYPACPDRDPRSEGKLISALMTDAELMEEVRARGLATERDMDVAAPVAASEAAAAAKVEALQAGVAALNSRLEAEVRKRAKIEEEFKAAQLAAKRAEGQRIVDLHQRSSHFSTYTATRLRFDRVLACDVLGCQVKPCSFPDAKPYFEGDTPQVNKQFKNASLRLHPDRWPQDPSLAVSAFQALEWARAVLLRGHLSPVKTPPP